MPLKHHKKRTRVLNSSNRALHGIEAQNSLDTLQLLQSQQFQTWQTQKLKANSRSVYRGFELR